MHSVRRIAALRHSPLASRCSALMCGDALRSNKGSVRWHGGPQVASDAPTITVTFLQPDDTTKQVEARVGESLLQTAHRNHIDLEGACEGGTEILVCS